MEVARRKIIKQGLGGRTISLPIDWVRKNNLRPGDDVKIYNEGNHLIITPTERPVKTTQLTITPATNKLLLRTLIANAYRSGAERIVLRPTQKMAFSQAALTSVIKEFPGLTIEEQDYTIIMMLKDDPSHIRRHLRVSFQIAKTALEEVSTQWGATGLHSFRQRALKERDITIRNVVVAEESADYIELASQLEKVIAHSVYLNDYLRLAKPPRCELPEKALQMLLPLKEAFEKNDFQRATTAWNTSREQLYRYFPKGSSPRGDPGVQRFVFTIMRSLRHIASRLLAITAEKTP